MLKDNLTCDSQKGWICKLLFAMFLAYFAQSPIADAYTDSLCSPLFFLDYQSATDDPVVTDELNLNNKIKSIPTIKTLENSSSHYHELLQALIKYRPASCIEEIQISANNIKSSQIFPPLSSDPSPPVI
jgi:hypothetical protein